MQKVSDEEIKKIFEEAEAQGIADRNETYGSDDIEITLPTEAEHKKALEEANNPEYDVYDTEEDWDG